MPRTGSGRHHLHAPFLRSVQLNPERVDAADRHPFDLPALAYPEFRIDFTSPITILVGPNGSGKSTIVEAIASLAGFAAQGGNRNFAIGEQGGNTLADALRAAWLPKMTSGFLLRPETLARFIDQVDRLADEAVRPIDRSAFEQVFGGRSGNERSHGEGTLELLRRRLGGRGLYLLDEPEAALSPAHQVEFLRILREAERRRDAQFVIATHSPMLMAYPTASLLHLTPDGLLERPFDQTEHFRILSSFYRDPSGFMERILDDEYFSRRGFASPSRRCRG